MSAVNVFLVGAGIHVPSHFTLETLAVLDGCERIVTNLPLEKISLLPSSISTRVESLWPLYKPGRVRRDNYNDVTAAVLSIAETYRPIAWLTVGHPSIFDSVTSSLIRECRRRDWTFRVVPAISSIDTIIAALAFEPAGGLFICEATSLVRRQIALNPTLATMLLQPSAFQSDRAMLRSEDVIVSLSPLVDYLRRYYPDSHLCAFVRTSIATGSHDEVKWVELHEFDQVNALDIAGSTLFIPAIQS